MNLQYLGGFALVTETRRVAILAGDGVIRFEGVAGGILPESAIVTGLPEGVVEKNQDANLLSPASLLGASTGRQVSLRRTNRRTGKVTEQDVVIRSGSGGQVVLQTADGFEALRCTGIPETIVYPSLPEGLSAKPTLSVRTHSARAAEATITLSYLADNFDWQANYVATLAPDGKHLDLFAWVTLASADETSFARAQAAVVAGRLNRTATNGDRAYQPQSVALTCWPSATTSDIPLEELRRYARASQMAPPPPPPAPMAMMAEDILVSGSLRAKSAMTVAQENLGDLKLYRVPEPVTVAAHAQKQVALLDKVQVPITLVWKVGPVGEGDNPARLTLRAKNRVADGLGLPLPAGKVAVYQAGSRDLLLGEGSLGDKAIGEDVEVEVAQASNVIARGETVGKGQRRLTVTNANPYPVAVEAKLVEDNVRAAKGLKRKYGAWQWSVTVPAKGQATLNYRTSG